MCQGSNACCYLICRTSRKVLIRHFSTLFCDMSPVQAVKAERIEFIIFV